MADSNGPEPDRAVRLSSMNAPPALRTSGGGRLTVGPVVDVIVDAIEEASATVADVQRLADVLRTAVLEGVSEGVAAARIEQQAPMFGRVGRWMNANPGLIGVLAIVISVVVACLQAQADRQPQPGPVPDVPARSELLDRGEVERLAEERMREPEPGPVDPAPPAP